MSANTVWCPRCDGSGEEPGAPVFDDAGVALCDLCQGKTTVTPAQAAEYAQSLADD